MVGLKSSLVRFKPVNTYSTWYTVYHMVMQNCNTVMQFYYFFYLKATVPESSNLQPQGQ